MPSDPVTPLLQRIDATAKIAAGRFPLAADPLTGEWTWSDDGGWSGGFWAGLLRLAGIASGDRSYAQAADEVTDRLAPRGESPTVLRGFLFWYSAGLADVLGQGQHKQDGPALRAAQALLSDLDAVTGLIPPGTDDAELYGWPRPGACIDGLPGTIPLLTHAAEQSGDHRLADAAATDAHGHRKMCVRPDGSVAQSATYDTAGRLVDQTAINGSSKHSTWSRAQAWAMLGFTQAAHRMPEFLDTAVQVSDWYLAHVPEDLVCFWDFDEPSIPDAVRDTSATAIAAAALVKLAPLAGDRYRTAAARTVTALTANHLNDHGGLADGCYNRVKHVAIRNELIWGDYFLLEAALALDGVIDTACI